MKIALIDDPKNCADCPLYDSRDHYCWYTGRHTEEFEEKEVPDWCELVEVPEKRPISDGEEITLTDMYNGGFNRCIDLIWGKK